MKVVELKKGYEVRYAIADDNGKVVDDAQGYGYTTKQKVMKAMWWKFKGGKQQSNEKAKWWKKHRELWHSIQEDLTYWWKEICTGEFTNDDINAMCKKKAVEI